jgi:hypothetical protein
LRIARCPTSRDGGPVIADHPLARKKRYSPGAAR